MDEKTIPDSRRDRLIYLKQADSLGWGPKVAKINPQRVKLIKKYLWGNSILDLGCGSGTWVDYLTRQGYQTVGVDFVKEFISQAKQKYRGKFLLADARKLPFKNNQFDTVLMIS